MILRNKPKQLNLLPYLFVFPAFALILVFKIYPIFSVVIDGFRFKGDWSFMVYKRVFEDITFWHSFWITVKINIIMIPFQIFISLLLALIVNITIKGIAIFRTIFYLPVAISLAVATILWNMMLNPGNGIINSILGVLNIPPQGFLINKNQALWSIVAIASWIGCGYWMMFLLAALKNIDNSIYESARIDGANWLSTIIKITLPMIKKVLLFVFVANTTTNILLFVPMQMVTMGGPESSTNVLMYEAYKSAFKYADRPRSAVMVTILLLVIALVCIGQFNLLNDKEEKVLVKR
jgi:ABC-type sugar transport system permease subunit